MSIVAYSRESKYVTVKLQCGAADEAFTMTQFGIYGSVDGGEEVLLAIFEDPDGVPIPVKSDSREFLYQVYATIMIGASGTLHVVIDTSVSVSMETMLEYLDDKEDKITATGLLFREPDGTIRTADPEKDLGIESGTGTFFGDSDSIASDKGKDVSADGLDDLYLGALLVVRFRYGTNVTDPTLLINDLPERPIVSRNQNTLLVRDYWKAGDYCLFLFDGTNWVFLLNFGAYIPVEEKGAAGGVATLDDDGKVRREQLRGGIAVQANAPTDTSLLWIWGQVAKYYDPNRKTWMNVLPVWG